jgi:putative (di)nucleoside polyphosphate hydrolase
MIKKLYRPNVAIIVLSSEYPRKKRIFLAKRNDMDNIWQFPQGGIDDGESSKKAMFRELEEEIGTDKVKIISRYPKWLKYDFPKAVKKRMKPYSGQKQRYYLVRLKKSAKIDINTKKPEFCDYKFVKPKELFDDISHFKKPIYKKVIKHFKQKGYL